MVAHLVERWVARKGATRAVQTVDLLADRKVPSWAATRADYLAGY